MKIGILITAYNCDKYIKDCLQPWINLRESHNIIISANSGMFKPYKDFGFEEKNDYTLNVLNDSKLDFLVTTSGNNLLDEDSSRNVCLDYLKKQNVDLVWVVDGDEIYTERQILDIIDFIKNDKNHSSYFIQFKNYTLKYPFFTKGFSRETIYRTDVEGGVSHFHFDVFITYNSGKTNNDLNNGIHISKDIAYVEHYSWLSDDSRSYEKITYQENRFSGPEGKRCAFKVIDGKLGFNEEFWKNRNLNVPILNVDNNPYTYDFEITYHQDENTIYVDWITKEMNIDIKIFSLKNKERLSKFKMKVLPGVRYYIVPPEWLITDKNFEGFNIEVWENDNIIHKEDILLKTHF